MDMYIYLQPQEEAWSATAVALTRQRVRTRPHVLTAFVDICRNLDGAGGVVDLVFEVGIVHKLQLQRRRALQRVLLFPVLCLHAHTHTHT